MTISQLPTPRPLAIPTRTATALVVASLALLLLWVFPYHARVNNPNENVRIFMTVAMVEDHTFAINRMERDWGYTNDKAARDLPITEIIARRLLPDDMIQTLAPRDVINRIRSGHPTAQDRALKSRIIYSSKAPGTSYLGVPVYWLLTKITGKNTRPLTPAQLAAHHAPPLDRTLTVYILRLWTNIFPALLFAWFWHRFLGHYTSSPLLRDAVFYSTMAGSLLFAYSEMFASHSHNAYAAMGALMAIATVRRKDRESRENLSAPAMDTKLWDGAGLMFVAGLLGAAATMFEYPAGLATMSIALLIVAMNVRPEVRAQAIALGALLVLGIGGYFLLSHRKVLGVLGLLIAVAMYGYTLNRQSIVRLIAAGLGGALPTALTLLFHARCFGSPFKPGYSYLENPEFNTQTSQGFFGATELSWEAIIKLWLDPSFGMIPGTLLLLCALPGIGTWSSLRIDDKLIRRITAAILGIVSIGLVVKLSVTAKLIADRGWIKPATTNLTFTGTLLLALLALCSLSFPKARNADPAVGATMVLSIYLVSRLIGMMNNWRGGWTVGPRYLATLVPFLGLFALSALDTFANQGPVQRRIATVFAAGATVYALIVSGLASAFFPHIPESYVSPLFELFLPLLKDGYVPHNAGQYLFHWTGLKSLVPFFMVAGAVSLWVLRGDERRPVAMLAHAMGATAVVLFCLTPLAAVAHHDQSGPYGYITSVWEPALVRPTIPQRNSTAPPTSAQSGQLRDQAERLATQGRPLEALELYRTAAQ